MQFYDRLLEYRYCLRQLRYPYDSYTRRYRCIFIHIPKAAGTSVLEALGYRGGRKHTDFTPFLHANPAKFHNYFKFCFVRNPWDRLVSVYEYYRGGGNRTSDAFFRDLIETKFPTFQSFVMEYCNDDTISRTLLLRPQYLFVYNNEMKCMVDFVGRYEEIDSDFEFIRQTIGLKADLGRSNSSRRDGFDSYYDSESHQKVLELYGRDIELFDYGSID